MKKSDYGILFLVALVFFILLACLQNVPGYMDAEYYYGQGLRLISHRDLSELFIWNFLNKPKTIPVPGFSFWLPMTSLLAAAGMWISGSDSFLAAKIFFILMASCITIMAAFMANIFLPGRRSGWLAGLLTLFSGFYLPFVTITDTFTPYMFFGGLFFVLFALIEKRVLTNTRENHFFLLTGLVAGLMSLTRSDGVLWLVGGVLGALLTASVIKKSWKKFIFQLAMILLGFTVVMIPFYLRNFAIYHKLYPPGNGLMFWLTKYNDLFVYPSNQLSFSRWIETGIYAILLDRFKALGANLQTLIASGGVIVLTPIVIIGLWKKRKSIIIKLILAMLIGILGVMTVIFPFAGERGGFFHSLAALQVIFWSMVPLGLDVIIQWGVKRRNWKTNRSWIMFGSAIVIVVAVLSIFNFTEKLSKGTENDIPWNQTQSTFGLVEQAIVDKTSDTQSVVMVNDPPGYTLATGRPSIIIPVSKFSTLIDVSRLYNVRFLVINSERAEVLSMLEQEETLADHYELKFTIAGTSVYEFKP